MLFKALLISLLPLSFLSGCVMVDATPSSERYKTSRNIGWVVKGCLAIHNHDLRVGETVILHLRDRDKNPIKGAIAARASDGKNCDPLLEDRQSVNLLTGAAFYELAIPTKSNEETPELAIVTLDKGISTSGLTYNFCFANKGVNFSVSRDKKAIWQGYYFLAAEVPMTCSGRRRARYVHYEQP
jgi:hypothetical protein